MHRVVSERERLASRLSDFEFVTKIWPSAANFLLVAFRDAPAVMRHCESRKILLRHFGGELSDCIRISVGSMSENNRLLDAMSSFRETGNG